jgi:glucosamine--fructose-6-phosphate aminotransferase (isomerizing)
MCGIVGYAGRQQALPILLTGLRRLEYRGYDSAGVAVLDGGEVQVVRKAGKLSALEETLGSDTPGGRPMGSRPTATPTRTWTAPARWR